ncbi:MAG: hypothetical protein IK053_05150 [Muribaculaceae bacterium]|nr:hypothetical protein [Muribaculaceae bacterium]
MKKFFYSLILAALMTPAAANATAGYCLPDNIRDGNILHCFNWNFVDIRSELPNIAKAGFKAIQISPVQGNAEFNAEWYYAYMPYDFVFKANGNGSRDQLQLLCAEANKYGIAIIADVVANHVNPTVGYRDPWWNSNGRERDNGAIDYSNRYSVTHNNLGNYKDVNSELTEVQTRCKTFIQDLKSLGVKGIRWDAAKHIGLPSEQCNFWPTVCNVAGIEYNYGEMLDGPGGPSSSFTTLLNEYTQYMDVTDTDYSRTVRNAFKNNSVPTSFGNWSSRGVNVNSLVYWAESHDNYSNTNRESTDIPPEKIDRAYAFLAARKGAKALYLSRPPGTSYKAIKMNVKGSTHFTSPEVAAVNHFHNAMGSSAENVGVSGGVAYVARAAGGIVIVVGSGAKAVNIGNAGGYLTAGTYKDEVSGNTFTVTSSSISGQVNSTGIAVIYPQSMWPEPEEGDDYPDQVYLVGAPEGWTGPTAANAAHYANWKLAKTGVGVYEGAFDIASADAMFRFYADLTGWDGGDSFGSQLNDSPVNVTMTNNEYSGTIMRGKGSYNITNWKGGKMYLTVNLKESKVLFSDKAGVDAVNADNTEVSAVYYNLQGVRCDSPASGQVFIRVATYSDGSVRATKVLSK